MPERWHASWYEVDTPMAKRFREVGLPVRMGSNGHPRVPPWLFHVASWSIPGWRQGELRRLAGHRLAFESAYRLGGTAACDALVRELELYGGRHGD